MRKIVIAIDGFSSCGKSTMAKDLAREVGYIYVDTGAMYRSVTLYALRNNLFDEDGKVKEEELISKLDDINICFKQKLKDRISIITSKDDNTFVVKEVRYRT